MTQYADYELDRIQKDLEGIFPTEALSFSIFERINNAVDPYTNADDISPQDVPSVVVRPL